MKYAISNNLMNNQFNNGISLLKLLAAFGIVGCHLNMRPTTKYGEMILHFTGTNVALFGIISGYFLLYSIKKTNRWRDFLWKKTQRLLPVYLFWTIFYVILKILLDLTTKGEVTSSFKNPMRWFYIVFWGDAAAHLWYVISYFYISIIVYSLRRWICYLWPIITVGALIWCIKGWCGFFSWYPIRLMAFISIGIGISLNSTILSRVSRIGWIAFFLFSVIIHLFSPWRGWISIYDILVSVPLVMLFKDMTNQISPKLVYLSNCSFGIYLTHIFIAFAIGEVLRKIINPPYSAWLIIFDWTVIIVISLTLTLIIQHVPKLKYVVK